MSAVGERGQVTIPKAIRERFGLTKGTRIEFEVDSGGIRLRKRAEAEDCFARKNYWPWVAAGGLTLLALTGVGLAFAAPAGLAGADDDGS